MVGHTDASKVETIVCLGTSPINCSTTQACLASCIVFTKPKQNKNETKQKRNKTKKHEQHR